MKNSEVVSGIFPYIDPINGGARPFFVLKISIKRVWMFLRWLLKYQKYDRASVSFGTKYSRMGHVKFVEDCP